MSNRKKGLILITVVVAIVIGLLVIVTVRNSLGTSKTAADSNNSTQSAAKSAEEGTINLSETGKLASSSNSRQDSTNKSASNSTSSSSTGSTTKSASISAGNSENGLPENYQQYFFRGDIERDKDAPALTKEQVKEAAERSKKTEEQTKADEIKYITIFNGSQAGKINNAFNIMMKSRHLLYRTPEECGINASFYEMYAGGSPVNMFGIQSIGLPGELDEENQILKTGIDGKVYVFDYTLDSNGNVDSITMNGVLTSVEREMQQTFDYDDYDKLSEESKLKVDSTRKEIMARYGVETIADTKTKR